MRLVAFFQYTALVIGSIGMLAGQFFGLAKGFNLGVFVVGAGFAIGGIDSLVTRRMVFRPSDEVYENYAGTPAVIVGLMMLVVGAAMIGAAYLLDNDQWLSTMRYLERRPAPLLAVGGLALVGCGVLMMLNPQGRSSWVWRILIYFPRWLLGVLVIAAGIAVIALGAWEWLEPSAAHAFMKTLPQKLHQLLSWAGLSRV
jgi:uncharacterized membrane protein YidH (DUF202 family)